MLETLFTDPLKFLIWAVVVLASFAFHEFSHAAAATALGDDTARRMGRLTLNPIPHVDPIGFLAMLTAGFGWGKPVPFNPYNLRDQKWGPAMVGAAGPASNLLLLSIAAIALKVGVGAGLSGGNALAYFLAMMIFFNAALLFFNLIPIPPLDGSKFLLSALSDPKYFALRQTLELRGPFYLILLILVDNFVLNGLIFGTIFRAVLGLISRAFGLGGVL